MVQVYPNPATDFVTIRFAEALSNQPVNFVVTDMMGRKLLSEDSVNSLFTIDVSQWPSGVYVIRLAQEGIWCVRKIVKR
jgi:hypothetical protein